MKTTTIKFVMRKLEERELHKNIVNVCIIPKELMNTVTNDLSRVVCWMDVIASLIVVLTGSSWMSGFKISGTDDKIAASGIIIATQTLYPDL